MTMQAWRAVVGRVQGVPYKGVHTQHRASLNIFLPTLSTLSADGSRSVTVRIPLVCVWTTRAARDGTFE